MQSQSYKWQNLKWPEARNSLLCHCHPICGAALTSQPLTMEWFSPLTFLGGPNEGRQANSERSFQPYQNRSFQPSLSDFIMPDLFLPDFIFA